MRNGGGEKSDGRGALGGMLGCHMAKGSAFYFPPSSFFERGSGVFEINGKVINMASRIGHDFLWPWGFLTLRRASEVI